MASTFTQAPSPTLPMPPTAGCTKADLDSPVLCLDLDLLESNIQKVAETCRQHKVAWRPHAKGHKIPEIARQQVAAGALGVTCAKLGEAEIMAAGGVRDLLIANLIVGPQKVARLVELRKRADPIVTFDHLDQARPIGRAMAQAGLKVRAILEVDVGLARVGVPLGEPALALAQAVSALEGIEFVGIMGYEGHLLTIEDQAEKSRQIHAALGQLVATAELLRAAGIPCPIVSVAGTGSYQITAGVPGITEIQAGGAVYMDAFYRQKCHVMGLEYAMTVLTTIVSRPTPERAIIDAGRKTLNIEVHTPLVLGSAGQPRDDIRVVRLSAEHGQLELSGPAQSLGIGDRLELIPGYGDLTTMLHDEMYGFRKGKLEVVWPIVGRGKLR